MSLVNVELLEAASKGDLGAVEDLFTRSPTPSLHDTDDQGRTVLHLALGSGNLQLIEYLLEKEAPLEAQDDKGQTALHVALNLRRTGAVHSLLQKIERRSDRKKIINLSDIEGNTVLNVAARTCDSKVINALIAAGADATIENKENFTPALTAVGGRHFVSWTSNVLHPLLHHPPFCITLAPHNLPFHCPISSPVFAVHIKLAYQLKVLNKLY